MFKTRRYFVVFLFMSLFSFLFARLFYLQIKDRNVYDALATGQHFSASKIEPRRGAIFDNHMDPLAINLNAPSIYCNAREITRTEYTAELLSKVTGIEEDVLIKEFSKDKAFVWIERKVSEEKAEKVKSLGLKGIYVIEESKRNYPNGKLASHIIGFAGTDNKGLEGLELLFDDELKGEAGQRHFIRDAKRRTVFFDEKESIPPKNGSNIILTIDSVIQFIAEEELLAMAKKHKSESASVIVMDPNSGDILALANYPDYDLNEFDKASNFEIRNHAVVDVYEPGSVFKIITASAAINEKVIDLDDNIYCEKGKYRSGGRILHDIHKYGNLAFRDVIAKSSNIGTVKVAQKLGKKKLDDYIRRFGFGEKTGIALPGEAMGISRASAEWSRSDITTIPIGQGIAVTPIQLVSAVSVIANGGYLIKPHVVDKVITWKGEIDKEFKPSVKRKVLNSETCDKMKEVMERVITDGTGKRFAKSKRYKFCGKTGTAQMVNPAGGYFKDKHNATFIGFAPKDNPLVSIVVTAKGPHPKYYGGTVAGPVFKNIGERVLQYLESNVNRQQTTN